MSDHKRFSPSSLHRVMECPASLLFIESLPPSLVDRSDSIWARRGTCGHTVSEMVLKGATMNRQGKIKLATRPADYLGQEIEEIIVDEDILAAVIPYVRYCLAQFKKSIFAKAESQLDLADWKFLKGELLQGDECGGTMDYISIYEHGLKKIMEVTDLKTGSGVVVEVKDNPQLLTYGLCALVEYHGKHKPTHVKITIVQPLAEHPDGYIRSVMLTSKELMRWGREILVPTLNHALSGTAEFNPSEEACMWCPAKAQCKAAYEYNCDMALAEFTDVLDVNEDGSISEVKVLDLPQLNIMTAEQKSNIMEHGDEIIDFIKKVHAAEHIRAEKGETVVGFKLVYKRSNRIYGTEEKIVRKALNKIGLSTVDFTDPPKLKSPSQVETVMKSKGIGLDKQRKFFDNFVVKPETGTNLVPESHSGREVKPAIQTEFANLIDDGSNEGLLDF